MLLWSVLFLRCEQIVANGFCQDISGSGFNFPVSGMNEVPIQNFISWQLHTKKLEQSLKWEFEGLKTSKETTSSCWTDSLLIQHLVCLQICIQDKLCLTLKSWDLSFRFCQDRVYAHLRVSEDLFDDQPICFNALNESMGLNTNKIYVSSSCSLRKGSGIIPVICATFEMNESASYFSLKCFYSWGKTVTEVLSAQRPPSPNVSVVGSRAKEKDATSENLNWRFVAWVELHLQHFFQIVV